MDVRIRPLGNLGCVGGVLSLGLLPLILRSHEKQFPASLTDDGMRLRNGVHIPWSSITRFRARDVLLNGRKQHTLYELWHPGGRVHFPSHRIEDADRVVDYMVRHLPPGIAA